MQSILLIIILISLMENAISIKKRNVLENRTVYERDDFEVLLQEAMINNLRPYKCVVVICDYVYYDAFQSEWFRHFGMYITFVLILVEENEDLFSPSNYTLNSLLLSKKEGCQAYIILISNGIQVTRLLRFGDRYRILDTRAKFILLYDIRLYEKDLNYLWKRIVSVIFIRKYEGIKKRGQESNMPWFEITTVPFPSPIGSIFVPKRLDIWRRSKFRKGSELFRDKTYDLRNQTLQVVVFPHIPAVTRKQKLSSQSIQNIVGSGYSGYTGLEIEILVAISKAMRFNCEYYEPEYSESELWGVQLVGGQFSGLFGEMVNAHADIALGDLYYTPYILELMDLTTPHSTECLTFLTPESFRDNSWKTLVLPFKSGMWAAVIICLFLTGLIFYALARFHYYLNETNTDTVKNNNQMVEVKTKRIVTLSLQPDFKNMDTNEKYTLMKEQYHQVRHEGEPEGLYLFGQIANSFLYTYSMLLLVSLPKFPTGWSLRMLTGWYWLYCTLLVVSYRASMTAILAKPAPRITIDTIQELVDSRLKCGGRGEINREFFRRSPDPASHIIGEKFEIVNDTDNAVDRVADGLFAFYENVHFLKEASVKRQLRLQFIQTDINSNETKSGIRRGKKGENLHIMSDCMIKMPISIGLQKNSPLKPRVDRLIRRILEAGLITKWLDDVMTKILNMEIPTTVERSKAYMSMNKFFGALVVLSIGYFLSIVALITENVYYHFFVKKHPLFNKYLKNIKHLKDN